MAICIKHNYLPENHTISDLIDAVNRVIILDRNMVNKLLEIEKYQNICSVNDYNRETGKIKDIGPVIKLGNDINELTKNELQ